MMYIHTPTPRKSVRTTKAMRVHTASTPSAAASPPAAPVRTRSGERQMRWCTASGGGNGADGSAPEPAGAPGAGPLALSGPSSGACGRGDSIMSPDSIMVQTVRNTDDRRYRG